jgi:hypothetical protein
MKKLILLCAVGLMCGCERVDQVNGYQKAKSENLLAYVKACTDRGGIIRESIAKGVACEEVREATK